MLILTRRISETLKIGDDVEVTVFGIKGNQVRIGINAPRELNVVREELLTAELSRPTYRPSVTPSSPDPR